MASREGTVLGWSGNQKGWRDRTGHPLFGGVSATHPRWIEKTEDMVAASIAFCVSKIRQQYHVCIVSDGISYPEAEKLRFTKFGSILEALDYLTRKYGPKSKITVLTHGG